MAKKRRASTYLESDQNTVGKLWPSTLSGRQELPPRKKRRNGPINQAYDELSELIPGLFGPKRSPRSQEVASCVESLTRGIDMVLIHLQMEADESAANIASPAAQTIPDNNMAKTRAGSPLLASNREGVVEGYAHISNGDRDLHTRKERRSIINEAHDELVNAILGFSGLSRPERLREIARCLETLTGGIDMVSIRLQMASLEISQPNESRNVPASSTVGDRP